MTTASLLEAGARLRPALVVVLLIVGSSDSRFSSATSRPAAWNRRWTPATGSFPFLRCHRRRRGGRRRRLSGQRTPRRRADDPPRGRRDRGGVRDEGATRTRLRIRTAVNPRHGRPDRRQSVAGKRGGRDDTPSRNGRYGYSGHHNGGYETVAPIIGLTTTASNNGIGAMLVAIGVAMLGFGTVFERLGPTRRETSRRRSRENVIAFWTTRSASSCSCLPPWQPLRWSSRLGRPSTGS